VILHALVVRGEMGPSRSVDRTSFGHAVVPKIGVKRKRYTLGILGRANSVPGRGRRGSDQCPSGRTCALCGEESARGDQKMKETLDKYVKGSSHPQIATCHETKESVPGCARVPASPRVEANRGGELHLQGLIP
jgi:hypothetical protein